MTSPRPISSSSAPAWAGRRWRMRWRRPGASILILEKGEQLPARPENRDARAIFQRGYFRPKEDWFDAEGRPFNPGNYYVHGGNSKFYGAVLIRYRARGFRRHRACRRRSRRPGRSAMTSSSPGTTRPRRSSRCAARPGEDPTEPPRSDRFPFPPVPDEAPIAETRERLRKRRACIPSRCRSASTSTAGCKGGQTPWDAFPDARSGKMDAETCALAAGARSTRMSRLETGAEVARLVAGAGRPAHRGGGVSSRAARRGALAPRLVVLAAGRGPLGRHPAAPRAPKAGSPTAPTWSAAIS